MIADPGEEKTRGDDGVKPKVYRESALLERGEMLPC